MNNKEKNKILEQIRNEPPEGFVVFLVQEERKESFDYQSGGGAAGIDADGKYWFPVTSLRGSTKTEIRQYLHTLPVVQKSIKFIDNLICLDIHQNIPYWLEALPDAEDIFRKYQFAGLQYISDGYGDAILITPEDLLQAVNDIDFNNNSLDQFPEGGATRPHKKNENS